MLKVLVPILKNSNRFGKACANSKLFQYRTFLSQAYYCNEVWEQRFKDPLIDKVNVDDLYNELDLRYQKTKNISAVDVDIFVNGIKNETYIDEALDLVHKLRLSADSSNTLSSTPHAVIRNLLTCAKTNQLLEILDDRLNYGVFLENFTANLLLDTFWKNKDYTSGARIASQLMLQEDFEHTFCSALSLLHCYNYLLNLTPWPQPPKPEEPEEEVKIRINYLRNPYDDNHFDLKDPLKIVGKTIMMITKSLNNRLEKSLHLVGVILFKQDVEQFLKTVPNETFYDVLNLIPDDNPIKTQIQSLKMEKVEIQKMLEDNVRAAEKVTSEKDIAFQCEEYVKWEQVRKEAMEKQMARLLTAKRLAAIEQSKEELKTKEELLWYFENEEKIELQIEEKTAQLATHVEKKTIVKTEEEYIPPEVQKKYA